MIPFNKPYLTGRELHYISEAHARGQLAGDGYFTKKCNAWLEQTTGCHKALLTHSCTAALEMAAILADIQAGDEVIMPSYTFVSTANAFVLRGGVPVFVDIREDTLNIDERLIEAAITPRTKAIVPVHYAGVGCEMDSIMEIARKHNLLVIEDAAQGVMASYKGVHWDRSGISAATPSTKPKTSSLVRGEPCWSITQPLQNEQKSSAKKGPIVVSSSAVRLTSTPGLMSVLHIYQAGSPESLSSSLLARLLRLGLLPGPAHSRCPRPLHPPLISAPTPI